jgi:glycosyltransferase involved in cell wall biosynthesis
MPDATRIVGLFPDLLAHGGVQEAGRQTMAALSEIAAEQGWQTRFLSLNDPAGPHSVSVRSRSISFTGYQRAKAKFVFAACRAARKNARIIFAAHPNLGPPASVARKFGRDAKVIVVTHGVDVWDKLSPQRRKALLEADLVLAPSAYTAAKLTEVQGVPAEKIERLAWPLGTSFLKLAEQGASLPLPASFPKAGPVILSVGRWAASEQYKGADDLILATAKLRAEYPTLSLVLVGAGDDLPRLRAFANANGLGVAVRFLENLPRNDLVACYAHCDIFALPSTGEGFGLVFLEAMALSKPVIGAASGGALDIIRDGRNGILVPPPKTDPAALEQALSHLLADPELRQSMGREGSRIVKEEYSVAAFQQSLQQILAGLIT